MSCAWGACLWGRAFGWLCHPVLAFSAPLSQADFAPLTCLWPEWKAQCFFCQKRKKWSMLRLKFSSLLFLRKHFQDFCIISAVWAHSNFKYIPTNLRIKTRPVSITPHIPVCKPWLVGKLNSFSCWLQRKCSVALNHSPSYISFFPSIIFTFLYF